MRIPLIAVAIVMLVSAAPAGDQDSLTPAPPKPKPKLTFTGDVALLTVAIRPEKSTDFEEVMGRMKLALMKSEDPNRRQQAAGWEVMKLDKPLPDGNVAYVHIVHPVVEGADYAIMPMLYDAFPDERQALYELYRGAFVQNLSLATGQIVVNMSPQP